MIAGAPASAAGVSVRAGPMPGLDQRVGPWEDQALVPVVEPPHQVRRGSVFMAEFGDHADAFVIANVSTLQNQAIADVAMHEALRPRTVP
jgi:hypothetical protein